MWQKGISNGGETIIDYEVWWDAGAGDQNYVKLAQNVLLKEYTATGLSAGVVYSFKVKSRNSVGLSLLSESVEVLAAQIPDVPSSPTTSVNPDGMSVKIQWTAPYSGGSVITSYSIAIR